MKMQMVRMRKFVMLRNNEGFTMIEMLLSLVIFMIISTLVLQIFTSVNRLTLNHTFHQKEWEMFTLQLQSEIRNSTEQLVADNKLYLLVNERIVTIEYYSRQNMVRRQVDGVGHEVMLQEVKHFDVEKEANQIIVQLSDYEGNQYRREFHSFLRKAFIQS